MLIRIKTDAEVYEIDPDKLTLGEARTLKANYGLESLGLLDPLDPDVLTGLLVVAMKRSYPALDETEIRETVEALDAAKIMEGFSVEERPTRAAKGGKSGATTRKTSGKPRSPASTA